MYAAGIAWERALNTPSNASGDRAVLRERGFSRRDIDAFACASGALLSTREEALERVTRALLERRTLRAEHVRRIALGTL